MKPESLSQLQQLLSRVLSKNAPPNAVEHAQLRRFLLEANTDCVRYDHEIATSKFALRDLTREHRALLIRHDKLLVRLNDGTWDLFNSFATRLAQLTFEMEALEKRLEELEVGREKRYRRRDACMAALSPFRSLPSEIISEIFKSIILDTESSEIENVLRLLHICRDWRTVAERTPDLWTHLSLSPTWKDDDDYPYSYLVEEWLLRSGALPLRLELNLGSLSRQPSIDLLSICLRFSERWAKVNLTMPEWDDMSVFLSIAEPEVLHSLTLRTMYNSFGKQSTPLALSFAPSLTSVSLDLRACHPLPKITLPWSQLSYLEFLVSGDIHLSLRILRMCFGVIRCKLDFQSVAQQSTIVEPFPLIRIPSLEALEISSGVILGRILNCITLRGLHTLALRMHNKIPLPLDSFVGFLTRSLCNLSALTLRFIRISPDGFARIFPLLPDLVELTVEGGHRAYFSDLIFVLLDPSSPATTIFPPIDRGKVYLAKLERLRVDCSNLDATYLVGFIQTRWYETPRKKFGLSQLKTVRVSTIDPLGEDSIRQILACMEEGLDVAVRKKGKIVL